MITRPRQFLPDLAGKNCRTTSVFVPILLSEFDERSVRCGDAIMLEANNLFAWRVDAITTDEPTHILNVLRNR